MGCNPRLFVAALAALATATAAGCGGGGGGGGGGVGSCTPTNTRAVTVGASGVTPLAVCILPGGTVTFTNSDTAAHDIRSDSRSGAACPELNVGVIPATESRAATIPTVGVCTYHDENDPSNVAFQGTVAVAEAPVIGPGY